MYQYYRQKQHNIPLIVSHQIRIANVSPSLTDAHMHFNVGHRATELTSLHTVISMNTRVSIFLVCPHLSRCVL